MTHKQINKQFEQYTPLLHKLSHQSASRCGRPEEDVFQQACYLFMQAAGSFDPKQGVKFGTYLYPCIRNGLIEWGRKNDLPRDPEMIPDQITGTPSPDKAVMMKEWLEGLSEECHEVAMIILNGPAEVLDLTAGMTPKAIRGALRRYLRNEKNWSWPKIWGAIRTMKSEVASL